MAGPARSGDHGQDFTPENETRRRFENFGWHLSRLHLTSSGVAVLGRWKAPPGKLNYIEKAKVLGASYFDVGAAWTDLESRGLAWLTNRHFLDVITDRGDTILLSTASRKLRKGELPPDPRPYFFDEIEYITKEKGYKRVNQWKLVPGR